VALRFERIWGPSVCCDRSFAQRRSGFRLQARTITPSSQNRACRGPRQTPACALTCGPQVREDLGAFSLL
jgi:hypothetical protein